MFFNYLMRTAAISLAIIDFTPKNQILGAFASSHMGIYNLFKTFKNIDPILYNDIACDPGTTLPTNYLICSVYDCGHML